MTEYIIPSDADQHPELRSALARGAQPGDTIHIGRRGVPMLTMDLPEDRVLIAFLRNGGTPHADL